MIPQKLSTVIPRGKLVALGNTRRNHGRKRSLVEFNARKALHLGLSHLKKGNEGEFRPLLPLELNCKGENSPIRLGKAVKSQPVSGERIQQSPKTHSKLDSILRSSSVSSLPIAVLKLLPSKPFKLPQIHRELHAKRSTQPIFTGLSTYEETKDGRGSVMTYAEKQLSLLEDRKKAPRGRLKRLLSIPTMLDASGLGVYPKRRAEGKDML